MASTSRSFSRRRGVRFGIVVAVVALSGVIAAVGWSRVPYRKPTSCSGSPNKPGVLAGKVTGTVIVRGVCFVNAGSATVNGSVEVTSGSALGAIFGRDDMTGKGVSNLTITGNLTVDKGGTAFIGCEAAHSACKDDSQKHPKLGNKITIGGSIRATDALAVISHVTTVKGNVVQNGGGGGQSCKTMPGIFAVIKSPAFSDYEDDSVAGSVTLANIASCWLGVLRDTVGKSFTLKNTKMADPDAIEVGDNTIGGNLACSGNTNAVPISAVVWDTADTTSKMFPRRFKPNNVKGTRSGQCLKSTATSATGANKGAHPF